MSHQRPSPLRRSLGLAAMLALAAGAPAAALRPEPPHRRALYETVFKRKVPKHAPGGNDRLFGKHVRCVPNPRRRVRRFTEALYRAAMGSRMSARTWRQVRKAERRKHFKHRNSLAGRFLLWLHSQPEAGHAHAA